MNFAVLNTDTLIVENVILAGDDFEIEGKTLIASDVAAIGDLYDPDKGEFIRPEPEPEPLPTDEKPYQEAVELLIENTAKERGYNGSIAICSYINSKNARWKTEAEAFIAWRDDTWSYAFEELRKVREGERDQPTVEEFIEELEPIEWPLSTL